jgi:glycosyltransferase involved in cell wall biosynthesis
MREQLQALIDELGLSEKIWLTGVRDDVPALMRRLSVLCLTSRSEGMPNVVLEAMAAACPVVATRVGDVPEVIQDGTNGFLVDSEDTEGLARVVVKLLRDAELAERIGAAGRATVEQRFSCQRMAQEIEQVYLRALAAKCPEFAGQWGGW